MFRNLIPVKFSTCLSVMAAWFSHKSNVILLVVIALATPGVAGAQTVQQSLRDFGMLGTWANDCTQPASDNNFHTVFSVSPSGQVMRTQYDKPGSKRNEYTIMSAKRIAADELWYLQVSNGVPAPYSRIELVLTRDGDRFRYLSSKVEGGDAYMIKDGKFVSNGNESAWNFKCK